jgi:hypothetical protein
MRRSPVDLDDLIDCLEEELAAIRSYTHAENRSLYTAERLFAAAQHVNCIVGEVTRTSSAFPESCLATVLRFCRKACKGILKLDREELLAKKTGKDEVAKTAEEKRLAWVEVIYEFERDLLEGTMKHINSELNVEEAALGGLLTEEYIESRCRRGFGSRVWKS